jgi:hypothetical protein
MYFFLILYINDIRSRFWSRIIIIIILLLLLLIIAGIIAAVIYLTRIKTNNVNISCSIKLSLFFFNSSFTFYLKDATMSTTSDDFPSKSTQATNLISSINYSDLQYSQQTISAPTKMIGKYAGAYIFYRNNFHIFDPCTQTVM